MSQNFQIIELQGVCLPDDATLKRKHVRPEDRWTQHYLDRYDRTTLIYDCFYHEEKRCFVLTAPRFLNLWSFFKQNLYVDGKPNGHRIKRQTWQRCEQVELYAPAHSKLAIKSADINLDIPVRQSQQSIFSDKNVALAISQNNDISWIEDWVRFHINAHGMEGVCIIDNASTDYSAELLLSTLQQIDGLKSAVILKAPFPYGPANASKKLEISPRFLQTSMFNLVKRDLFNSARAVLSVDIDELVIPNSEVSVFDAAVSTKVGAISFRELKVYPNEDEEKAYPQRSHRWVKSGQKPGNTKWCVSGKGFINRFGWAVHRFGGGFFLLTETAAFTYIHCHATSTSWKKDRFKKEKDLVISSKVANALDTFLEMDVPNAH